MTVKRKYIEVKINLSFASILRFLNKGSERSYVCQIMAKIKQQQLKHESNSESKSTSNQNHYPKKMANIIAYIEEEALPVIGQSYIYFTISISFYICIVFKNNTTL